MAANSASVLVVDDESEIADLYTAWLQDFYDVRPAYGGRSALEQADADTDVVLLDRRMPDLTGDEVLEEIRSRELRCHVAMVTAVEPDFDIVEMGFDDYVVKPVDREDLHSLVERMLAFDDLGPGAQQYYAGMSKRSVLESQKGPSELESNPEFEALNDGIEAYGGTIVSLAEEAVKDITREQLSSSNTSKRVELNDWERKLESLDPDDPLYRVAKQRVEELRSTATGDGGDGKRQFLEAVADGFVAEGHWLDSTVKRALNLIIYNNDREKIIINRQALTDLAQEGTAKKFEVSQHVRGLAKDELSSPV